MADVKFDDERYLVGYPGAFNGGEETLSKAIARAHEFADDRQKVMRVYRVEQVTEDIIPDPEKAKKPDPTPINDDGDDEPPKEYA